MTCGLDLAATARTAGFIAGSAKTHRTNVSNCLALDWDGKHHPIMHDECPPLKDKKKTRARKRPACHEVGVCLCSPSGLQLWLIRTSWNKLIASRFKRKSVARGLLSSMGIVVRLRGTRAGLEDPWAIEAAKVTGRPWASVDVDIWWHIGWHQFSPFETTFRIMAVTDAQNVKGPGGGTTEGQQLAT